MVKKSGALRPVAATLERRRRVQVGCTVALVLGLHLVVIWSFLATSRVTVRPRESPGFETLFIFPPPAPPVPSEQRASPRRPESAQEKSSGHGAQPAPAQRQASVSRIASQPHAPIDWAAELKSAAKEASADKSATAPRDFGFPHLPAAPADAPQFGWDYAATHRVESIPEGGLLVHLNDNCVLVLWPLPFMGCGIGKKQANGDLFENMGNSREAERGPSP